MDIRVGAFDPNEEKCMVYVDLFEQSAAHSGNVKVGVWVENMDSRSALYEAAKKEALVTLELAIQALKADLSE